MRFSDTGNNTKFRLFFQVSHNISTHHQITVANHDIPFSTIFLVSTRKPDPAIIVIHEIGCPKRSVRFNFDIQPVISMPFQV